MRAPGSIPDQGLTKNNNDDEDDTIHEITMYTKYIIIRGQINNSDNYNFKNDRQ